MLVLIGGGVGTPVLSFVYIALLKGSRQRPPSIKELPHPEPFHHWNEEFHLLVWKWEGLFLHILRRGLNAGLRRRMADAWQQSGMFLIAYVQYKLEDEFGQLDLCASSSAMIVIGALICEILYHPVTL